MAVFNSPVLVKDDNGKPNGEEGNAAKLAHAKGPGDERKVVQENVRQWWVGVHVGYAVVHNDHDNGRHPGAGEEVRHCYDRLPSFRLKVVIFAVMSVQVVMVVVVVVVMMLPVLRLLLVM